MQSPCFFYAWWVLTNGIMHYACFRFLTAVCNASGGLSCRRNSRRGHTALWLVMNGFLTLANTAFHMTGALLLYAILLAGFSRFSLNLQWRAGLAPIILIIALHTFTESLSALIMYWVSSNFNSAAGGQAIQLLLSLSMDVLYVFVLKLMEKQYAPLRRTRIFGLHYLLVPWALFVLPLRRILGMDSFGFEQRLRSMGLSFSLHLCFMVLGGAAVFFLLIRLFYRNLSLAEGQALADDLKQQLKGRQNYFEKIRKQNEQYASFQHDIRNHLLVLSDLIRTNHYEEAVQYAGKLHADSMLCSGRRSTGSMALDVLLEEKLNDAGNYGIRTACSVEIPPNFSVHDVELCMIFSNLLDNAVKACAAEEISRPFLSVSAKPWGGFLLIEVVNSNGACRPFQKGTGLSNIKKLTEARGGAMEIENGEGVFRVTILLCDSQPLDERNP